MTTLAVIVIWAFGSRRAATLPWSKALLLRLLKADVAKWTHAACPKPTGEPVFFLKKHVGTLVIIWL